MAVFEKSGAEVRARRTWLFFAQFAAIPLWGLVFELLPDWGLYSFLVSYAFLIAALLGVVQAWRRWPRVRRVALRADAAGLHLDGRIAVARKTIRSAHVHARGVTFVRLVRHLRPVEIVVDDEREG